MNLRVYTWFAFHSSDRCTDSNDTTLLDSWVIYAQGHFTKNNDFSRKISMRLRGCHLQAILRDNSWPLNTYIYI